MKVIPFFMLFILASCIPSLDKTALEFDDGAIQLKPLVAEGEPVTFEVLKEKLLLPHCIGCHQKVGDETKVLKWIEAGNAEESELYQVIKDGSMPKKAAALDSRYLDLVRQYIESIKPSEEVIPEPVPTQVVVKFETLKNSVIIPHCIGCHKKMGDETNIQKWIKPGSPKESEFYQVLEEGSMPKDADKLSSEKLDLVAKYIESLIFHSN